MKLKKILGVISLSLFAAVSVGAGVALQKKTEVVSVKADSDTWMANVNVDLHEMGNFDGFNDDSVYAAFWKGSDDANAKWIKMHKSGIYDENKNFVYSVNATFASTFEFNKVKFQYNQGGNSKESKDYELVSTQTEAEHYGSITAASYGSWNEGHTAYQTSWEDVGGGDWRWKLTLNSYDAPYIKLDSEPDIVFEEDIEHATYFKKR